jgi:uncharacterized protein YbcC (UPF0753/DUF2309 family)
MRITSSDEVDEDTASADLTDDLDEVGTSRLNAASSLTRET